MRERLSCVVELCRFGVWRSAVLVVAATAIATMAAWGGLALMHRSSDWALIATAAAAMAFASMLLAASLMRVDAGTLVSVDGFWTFTFDRGGIEQVEPGELAVALDVGSFLLLTLTRAGGSDRRARRWLPVQRRGLESDWHALRCAVYSPPLVAPERAAANEPLTE